MPHFRFLSLMEAGFPAYGCQIQSAKTRTNLDRTTDDGSSDEISFCGALLHAATMEARPDFSAHFGRSIVHTITFSQANEDNRERLELFVFVRGLKVDFCRSRFVPLLRFVLNKMLFTCTFKLDPLYLDPGLNRRRTVLANLSECFRVAAVRMDAMVQSVFNVHSSNQVTHSFVIEVSKERLNVGS